MILPPTIDIVVGKFIHSKYLTGFELLLLGEDRQVGSFWQVLAEQSIDVLADAAFPWCVRVGEEDLNAGLLGEQLVLGHLGSLVVGHPFATPAVHSPLAWPVFWALHWPPISLHGSPRTMAFDTSATISQAPRSSPSSVCS